MSGWGARLQCRSHEEEQGRSHHCSPVIGFGVVIIMDEFGRREHNGHSRGRGCVAVVIVPRACT